MENNSITNDQEIERKDDDDDLIQNELKDDLLLTSIKVVLETLPSQSLKGCICRVPWRLRKLKEEVYTPQVVSIGPFHRGEECFQNMEEYKLRYLKAFLVRSGKSLEYYLKKVRMWEQRTRNCYAEIIKLSSDEFVKMILVDASFIVELLLEVHKGKFIFDEPWMMQHVMYDMILVENQLPFFLLDDFFNSVPGEKPSLLETVCVFFKSFLNKIEVPGNISSHEIKHFVDFIHRCFLFSFRPKGNPRNECLPSMKKHFINFTSCRCCLPSSISKAQHQGMTKHFVDFIRRLFPKVERKHNAQYYERPPSVTELQQAGIKFKKRTSISFFDIKFANGILEIPQLEIDYCTRFWIQNLIAFEQCHGIDNRIFSEYSMLLDGMINASKDVDLLIHNKIMTSMLGSSEDVSTLFNNIVKEVIINTHRYSFSSLCQELNAYCKSPRHRWMATLRRDYFSTPWSIISVVAALILLVLTFIQSICSIKNCSSK